jgi:hypothetical protein
VGGDGGSISPGLRSDRLISDMSRGANIERSIHARV